MKIQKLILNSPNISGQKHFFNTVLGLPIHAESETDVTIQVGTSQLTFVQDDNHHPYHYAFDIPENQFEEAYQWLAEKVEVLSDSGGVKKFKSADWNADMVYFKDGDGNIAEFIARHNLATERMIPFSEKSILRISEIGLATPQVIKTAGTIQKQSPIKVWRGGGSETFTAMGDEEGLLIVVREGRVWRPTNDVISEMTPFTVEIEGLEQSFELEDLPYQIVSSNTIRA